MTRGGRICLGFLGEKIKLSSFISCSNWCEFRKSIKLNMAKNSTIPTIFEAVEEISEAKESQTNMTESRNNEHNSESETESNKSEESNDYGMINNHEKNKQDTKESTTQLKINKSTDKFHTFQTSLDPQTPNHIHSPKSHILSKLNLKVKGK